jgi:hypothetical protein
VVPVALVAPVFATLPKTLFFPIKNHFQFEERVSAMWANGIGMKKNRQLN